MMNTTHKTDELHILAVTLADVVKKFLFDRGQLKPSREPAIERRPIVEFRNQMRVFDLEKFDTPTYVSTVNYYADFQGLQNHKALGFLVIFIERKYIPRLLKLLHYPEIEENDEDALKDAAGALCNVLAGQFKTAVSLLCQTELEMSHFSYYDKSDVKGVEFDPKQLEKYEISFELEGAKHLVLEMSMRPLPLRM